VNRGWTWHEMELDPAPGAAYEYRVWLAVVFGLGGTAALDLELAGSEVVLWALEHHSFTGQECIGVSADRPPGAVHVEVGFPTVSHDPSSDPILAEVLDSRTALWGVVQESEGTTVWFEVAIPTAAWELEFADDADLVERMAIDERAGEELISRHSPLLRRLSARYRRAGFEADDLYQIAGEALLGAAARFERGAGSFERFVSRTVSGTLKRHLRDHGWSVRPPRGLQELVLELRVVEGDLTQRLGRAPSVHEIAEESGRSSAEIDRARRAATAFDIDSIDEPAGDGIVLAERLGGPDAALTRAGDWAVVDSALRALPEREREVVRLRYFEDLSQRAIADRVGVSQMHVSRLLRSSIADMRRRVTEE
jgi:RNA polymerase sigma-B factor